MVAFVQRVSPIRLVARLTAGYRLQPLLTVHCGSTAHSRGSDRLPIMRINYVTAGEDAHDIGGGTVIRQRVEQARGLLHAIPREGGACQQITVWSHRELALENRGIRH